MSDDSINSKEDIKTFVDEILTNIIDVENILVNTSNPDAFEFDRDVNHLFRFYHNVKGTSSMFGWEHPKEVFHIAESILSIYREKKFTPQQQAIDVLLQSLDYIKLFLNAALESKIESLRKPYKLLYALDEALTVTAKECEGEKATESGGQHGSKDGGKKDRDKDKEKEGDNDESIRITGYQASKMMEIVSDFIQLQNKIIPELSSLNNSLAMVNDVKRFSNMLQNFVLSIRLSPLRPLLYGLNRIVTNTARDLGKKVHLKVSGGDTQLDRRMIEMLREPLVHLLRNSIDHGIEDEETRKKKNKHEYGTINIEASQQSGQVIIVITDDGKGIDAQKVLSKAIQKGLLTKEQAPQFTSKDILRLVFAPGFSTAEKVTQVSGRGVGMDAVKSAVESVGGTVEITSELGLGTTVVLILPLTLAIVKSLTFRVGEQMFAIPQVSVEEVVTREALIRNKEFSSLEGEQEVIHRRKQVIPCIAIDQLFKIPTQNEAIVYIVIKYRTDRFALKVHSIVGTRDFVSQAPPKIFSHINVINGVGQLNSGEYIELLDLAVLFDLISQRMALSRGNNYLDLGESENVSDVFRSQQKMAFVKSGKSLAIPVQSITEVIEMPRSAINKLNDRFFITYRNKTYPMLRLASLLESAQTEFCKESYIILLVTFNNICAGIVCDEFLGIHRLPREFDDSIKSETIMGTITKDNITYLVPNFRKLFGLDFEAKVSQKNVIAATVSNSKFNVLIVEDDKFFATNLSDYLTSNGIKSVICEDGLEAKELLSSGSAGIHYIITDYEMPRMNGIELLRWIRKNPMVKDIPVALCTAVGDLHIKIEAEKLGIDVYAEKVKYDQFIEIVLSRKKKFDLGIEIQIPKYSVSSESTILEEKEIHARILTFYVKQKKYGIVIDIIKEISSATIATIIPNMIKAASQIVSFRGSPIPVIDLRRIRSSGLKGVVGGELQLLAKEEHPEQIVAQFGQHVCALWVDKVCHVQRLHLMDRSTGIAKSEFGSLSSLIGDVLWDKNRECIALIGPQKVELLIEKIIEKSSKQDDNERGGDHKTVIANIA
ncbi:MAG: chemotaxis protein CheW [Oligoflexia bacterium]|nr:chemotaxis protein CheW [Oligoflexia bacterium]